MTTPNRKHLNAPAGRVHASGARSKHRQPAFTLRNGYFLIDADDRFLGFVPQHLLSALDQVEAERKKALATRQPIFAHVANHAARELYGLLYRQMRITGGSLVVPLCYETHQVRRQIELTLTVLPSGAILHRCLMMRNEPRHSAPLPKPPGVEKELATACSWCNCIKVGEQWLPIDHLAAHEHFFQRPILPELTHGICPTCYVSLIAPLCDEADHRQFVN